MKTKVILASLLLSLAFISCKKEENKAPEKEIVVNNLKVSLDLVIQKDDSLQLFYKDDAIPSFDEKNSVWAYVKGSPNSQEVVFTLPEEIFPTSLRFDIGNKEGQGPVVINNFKMEYHDKVYKANDSTMTYFLPNDQLKYDAAIKTLTPVKVKDMPYDPFIYSVDALLAKQIKLLLK